MRLRTLVAGLTALAGGTTPAAAQSVGRMLESDFRDLGKDAWAVWVSPFHGSGRDWAIAAGTLAAGGLVSLADDDIDRWMVRHRYDRGWKAIGFVREGGLAFSGKTLTPLAGGLYVIGIATKNQAIRDGVMGCLASYVSTSVLRNQIFYRAISRTRPDSARSDAIDSPPAQHGDQYRIDFGSSDWGRHSFPAGHVANIAACASFLGNRFEMGLVEPLLYVFTAAVGTGRLVDRRHWTSDTFVGVVFGYAAGRLVAHRSLQRDLDRRNPAPIPQATGTGFYISPTTRGMAFGWQARF